jgi:hypothetical protein
MTGGRIRMLSPEVNGTDMGTATATATAKVISK